MPPVCPSCGNGLALLEIDGTRVSACQGGCGGFWFPRAFQRGLAGLRPGGGRALLHVERCAGVRVFRGSPPACPQCRTTLLLRHFSNSELDLEVDQCARCGGFWIEAGRLGAIAETGAGRDEQAAHYFARIFAESVSSMDVGNPEIREAANTLVQILSWICPRPFIPAEPPWWLERRPGPGKSE